MALRITYASTREDETVDADEWKDHGDWIDLSRKIGGTRRNVLRLRANDVVRIERVSSEE